MRQRALPLFPSRGKPRANARRKPPSPKEYALHKAVADHLRTFADSSWQWGHYPAGEKRDPRTAAKLKVMGVQRGWPDFLFFAPAGDNTPAGLMHALELKRKGEDLTEEQEAFAAWCEKQGVPFACTDDLGDALAILSGWGVLRRPVSGLGRVRR